MKADALCKCGHIAFVHGKNRCFEKVVPVVTVVRECPSKEIEQCPCQGFEETTVNHG